MVETGGRRRCNTWCGIRRTLLDIFWSAWRQRFIKVRYTGGTETNTDASAQKSPFLPVLDCGKAAPLKHTKTVPTLYTLNGVASIWCEGGTAQNYVTIFSRIKWHGRFM